MSEPLLWDLHHNTEADWRRILDGQPEHAARWIRFAAERGFKAAQLVLGQMYLDGRGVPLDPTAAYDWFAKAARIGSLDARNMLGRCHELGWGVPVDHALALSHYQHAARAGHAWAHYNIGCLLLYGRARRDHAEAFRCFARAAEIGEIDVRAKASGLLGRCHEEGWGTSVDHAAALRCYRLAADGGDCWGALNLGLLHLEAGRSDEAVMELERALSLASPHSRITVARALASHRDPVAVALARKADLWRATPAQKHPVDAVTKAQSQSLGRLPAKIHFNQGQQLVLFAAIVYGQLNGLLRRRLNQPL